MKGFDALTDAALARIQAYTVGLVRNKVDAKDQEVLGSGVLVEIEGRRGILTCGHVAEEIDDKNERQAGLIFFSPDNQPKLGWIGCDSTTLMNCGAKSYDVDESELDLAFARFSLPEFAESVSAKKGVYLNIDRNREKLKKFATKKPFADGVLGMVAKFSEPPVIEGQQITRILHGSLYTGCADHKKGGQLVFDPKDCPREKLPPSFGGTSGGGIWRILFEQDGDDFQLVDVMLIGIASWERKEEKTIVAQAWDRIEDSLIPRVLKEHQV